MEKTEIILHPDGKLTERVLQERELDAGQAILDGLTETVTRKVCNVMQIPHWGVVHANVGTHDTLWSIPIDRIPLHARFKLVNGVLLPTFASGADLEMPLVWRAPQEVRLVFAAATFLEDGVLSLEGNWLFACDREQRCYRLPLPNLHDECRICTGAFSSEWLTVYDCLAASLEQFNRSKWNSDLMRNEAESMKFFRFQPTNETFETLPIQSEDWTVLCEKVSTTLTERIIL